MLIIFRKYLFHGSMKGALKSVWSLGVLFHIVRPSFQQAHVYLWNMIFITKTRTYSFCLKPKSVSAIISIIYEPTDLLILISSQYIYCGRSKTNSGLREHSINAAAISVIAVVIIRNIQTMWCLYAINTAQTLV